jgi:hypothetical protein
MDDLTKDHYDNHFKSANYLLAAHAAGLIGCLSVLKDYNSTPQLKGLGVFVVLFGIGLIAAIVNYIAVFLARATVMNVKDYDPDGPTTKFLMGLHLCALAVALVALIVAIVILIFRFASL